MALNKIIYGSGRIPRPSEFTLGELIINVDDARIYSKDKQNNVFEISPPGIGFATASFHDEQVRDFELTSSKDNDGLIISGGLGIRVMPGSQPSSVIIQATGDVFSVSAATASYFDGIIDINSQTNLVDGTGLSFDGNTLNVDDIFLRNDQNESTNFNLTANKFIATQIVQVYSTSDQAAVAGGLFYSSSNEFYLGFS